MQENIDGYMQQVEQAYEEAVSMLGDMSSWDVYEDSPELAAYTRRSPSGLDILKIEFFIPRDPQKVLDFIYANICDIHNRLNPDLVSEHALFRNYSETQRIRYELIDPHVIGVSPRDILYFGIKLQVSEDVFALIETSVDHKDKPIKENPIRVQIHYALHFCEKLNDKCHVVSLAYADPKGSIPKTIINLGLRKRVDFYKVLVKEILANTA